MADLIGGPCSGQRLTLTGYFYDRPGAVWRQVLPSPPVSVAEYWECGFPEVVPARFAEYRRIGVRPDGRRVFAFHAAGSRL